MQELKVLSVEEKLNLDIPRISKEVIGAEFQKKGIPRKLWLSDEFC